MEWQIRDCQRAAARLAETAAMTREAGRPWGMGALEGDVAVLDQQIERLERRLSELKAVPAPAPTVAEPGD